METARSNRLIELRRPTTHKLLEFMASLPCVTYELDHNFITHTVSANVIDLIGIRQESLLGSRALWHERLFPADRDRLTAKGFFRQTVTALRHESMTSSLEHSSQKFTEL